MKISPGDWKNQFERMNMKVYEANGKAVGMVNGRSWKCCQFYQLLPLVLGGQACGGRKNHKR